MNGSASELLDAAALLPKAIDNSQIVREVDPRSMRQLVLLLCLVAALVGALVLYAWPNLELRQADLSKERLSRQRERLLEENRKLRLERAALENLKRVESIAVKELGMRVPAPENVIVVDEPPPLPPGAQLASGQGERPASPPNAE
jgi:cell division protein FtsL